MIYLLSQILLCLALAVLLGGALGWLLHRSRSGSHLDELHDALELRDHHLERARGEVAMLTDDIEDLRERSRVEIDALRQENERLPALAENLEKSQLLVRQMIQRHDAQTRELSAAKTVLDDRLAQLQEQVVSQERELVAVRAGRNPDEANATDRAARKNDMPPVPAASSVPEDDGGASGDGAAESVPDPSGRPGRALPPPDAASADPSLEPPIGPSARGAGHGAGAAEPLDETMDEVMEVDESLAAELLDDAFVDERRSRGAIEANEEDLEDKDEEDEDDANATLVIDVSMIEGIAKGDVDGAVRSPEGSTEARTDEASGTADHAARPLFQPVARQDDLQRIFGITPVTEKALNELGITSYPQLAELERPEIEKIARALEIVPETIERDDWVGNARRQLEDVLEQL